MKQGASRKSQGDTAVGAADRVRIDKWVWAARFFKTRSLAAQAVLKGRVLLDGESVKAAREVKIGDQVSVEIEGYVWELCVLGVSEVRGPASVARTLYEETEASRQRREAEAARRKLYREPAAQREGRPNKHERKTIERAGSDAHDAD